mgnify:CR=1 FL=1
MREMKDSNVNWLNTIPCDWALSRIKYVLNERIEKNDPIKTKDILSLTAKQGVVPLSEKEGGGNKPKEDFTAYKLAYPNDIVINSMNILSGSVGLSKYFGCVSPVYYMLRPFNDNFDVRYFNYIFQTKVFQLSLFGLGNGILIKESGNGKFNTIRMRIPMEKFGNLLIPVPNEKEQIKISNYLDTQCSEIDATAEDIQKEISLLEDYKKSVITEAVTKGLNPDAEMKDSGVKWLPKIPKHWKVIPSKYLFANSDIRRQTGDEQLTASQKYGIITQKDYTAKENAQIVLATQGLEKWKHVEPNDFIISLRSFQGGLEMSKITGCITWHYVVLKAQKKVYHKYYKWLFKSARYINALQGTCNFIRDGQDLRFSNFALVPLFELPLEEQQQIADYLDTKCSEIDTLIADKKRQLDILTDYKKSLIYEYITGKKEVPVKDF